MSVSEALRGQLRAEIARNVEGSPAAQEAEKQICQFYADHRQPESSRDLAQYVSLALFLGDPPQFVPTIRESDLPPDASYVLGLAHLLPDFYRSARLHEVYSGHEADFERMIDRASDPVRLMIQRTDDYLRLPISGYVGRRLVIYLTAQAAPGQVNARNYGNDYYLVISPATGGVLQMAQIRHTYLHFVLDPLALKRGTTMKSLEPLLGAVKNAPMDESFKYDIVLLVNESLIRAIEARQMDPGKRDAEPVRRAAVEDAASEGFILAPYFYDALIGFEKDKDAISLNDAYPDLLHGIDVGREKKRASEITWKAQAAPELMQSSRPVREATLLDAAESRLASGDVATAQQLAKEALHKNEDPARAMFVLARAATLSSNIEGARDYFQKTLEIAREPRMIAWSHIYLGRIFDLQEQRESAIEQYKAALAAGDTTPDTKAAAERGLKEAYAPPKHEHKQEEK